MTAPTGVRLHRADGTVLDCELAYEGTDAIGMHNWVIANAVYRPGDKITAEEIPPYTGIGFRVAGPSLAGVHVDWTDQPGGPRRHADVPMNRKQRRKGRRRWPRNS